MISTFRIANCLVAACVVGMVFACPIHAADGIAADRIAADGIGTGPVTIVATASASAEAKSAIQGVASEEDDSATMLVRRPMLPAPSIVSTLGSPSRNRRVTAGAGPDRGNRGDQIFLLNVRYQSSELCSVRLPAEPRVSRLDRCGRSFAATMDDYRGMLASGRPTVIYVHGNRYTASDAIEYGLYVYRETTAEFTEPINWVIWSWPADRDGILGADVRKKARRTDGQAFLLASVLRDHIAAQTPTTMIGFSFGGRVITGALHALAGGSLRGIVMPDPPIVGGHFAVGLIAPAIEQNWLNQHGYHRLATKNMEQLTVLYNRRDAVLKRYWRIERIRGQMALGYSGPRSFAPRVDGSRLPVRSRDCSSIVGLQHDETDYYGTVCRGEFEMARLVASTIGRTPGNQTAAGQPTIGVTAIRPATGVVIDRSVTPTVSAGGAADDSTDVILSRPMLQPTRP